MSDLPLHSLEQIQRYEQVPLSERFPLQTIPELLRSACERFADDSAIELLPTGEPDAQPLALSYRDFYAEVLRARQLLRELGVKRGQVLSLMLPILPEAQVLTFAAQCGGIANPLNPLLEPEHLAAILNAVGARVLAVCSPELAPELWPKVPYLLDHCPRIESLLLIGPRDTAVDIERCEGLPARVWPVDYRARLRACRPESLAELPQPEDIAAYFHTGGTTGRPKIAKLTQRNFAFVAQAMRDVTGLPRHTLFNGLPLFHIYGAMVAGLASLINGNRVLHLTPTGFRNPNVLKNFWPLVAKHRANTVPLVPTLFGLLQEAEVGHLDLSCLWEVGSGAAPLPAAFKRRFEQRFQLRVVEGYGMTESCCLISRCAGSTAPANRDSVSGGAGVRLPYTEVCIADLSGDDVVLLAAGESGQILTRGPNVFAGYLEERDNRNTWHTDSAGRCWFDTGDCGYLDDSGQLFITGRAKDLIIRGGHNIDPQLIEEPLRGHEAVADVVAVGMPDAHAGELPVVFVQRRAGSTNSEAELLLFAAAVIGERAAVPKKVFFLEQMPLTAVGKIFKPELRRRALEYAAQEMLRQGGLSARVSAELDGGGLQLRAQAEETVVARVENLLAQLPVPLAITEMQSE